MNRIFRQISRAARLFDISPIGGGSIPKIFLYIVWGLNAILFLGEDIINEHIFSGSSVSAISSASNCTVLKKVNTDAVLSENIEAVNSDEFIVISSCDNELVSFDVVITRKSRAPPAGTALC